MIYEEVVLKKRRKYINNPYIEKNSNQTELILNFIKSMIWPIITISLIIIFFSPLKESIQKMPEMIDRANRLKIGSIELELINKAKAKDQEDLAIALTSLDTQTIEMFIGIGEANYKIMALDTNTNEFIFPAKFRMNKVNNLYENGLIEFYPNTSIEILNKFIELANEEDRISISKLDESQISEIEKLSYKLTTEGLDLYYLLIEVVVELIQL
jgi:hypothetical protein